MRRLWARVAGGAALTLVVGCATTSTASSRKPSPSAEPARAEPPPDESTAALSSRTQAQKAAQAKLQEGHALLLAGQNDAAYKVLSEGLALDEGNGLLHLEWSKAAQNLGVDPQEIGPHLQTATTLLPQNPRAQFAWGFFLEGEGDLPKAEAAYRNTLALRKNHVDAHVRLGEILRRQSKAAEAATHFAVAASRAPERTDVWAGWASAAEAAGDLETAERALLQLVKLRPQQSVRLRQLVSFYKRTGDDDKAAQAQAKLDRKDPVKKRKLRKLKKRRRRKKK